MAATKVQGAQTTKIMDARHKTRGGQIRLEAWADMKTKQVVKYNLAYINHQFAADNGRVLGFDDDHLYPEFSTLHHCHWFGKVIEDHKFVSFDYTLDRFQRLLKRLKRSFGKNY